MKISPNIFIVGPFGAGKSTIGYILAQYLNRNFYDTDRMIEDRLGADISWIFDIEGEEKFLQREQQILQELIKEQEIIVATGGTMILSEVNRKLLSQNGLVIALSTDIEKQLIRTKHNKNKRPILRGAPDETEQYLRMFQKSFDHFYREIAVATFCTDYQTPKMVAKEIKKYLIWQNFFND